MNVTLFWFSELLGQERLVYNICSPGMKPSKDEKLFPASPKRYLKTAAPKILGNFIVVAIELFRTGLKIL